LIAPIETELPAHVYKIQSNSQKVNRLEIKKALDFSRALTISLAGELRGSSSDLG
jgi:hypothetical protein